MPAYIFLFKVHQRVESDAIDYMPISAAYRSTLD